MTTPPPSTPSGEYRRRRAEDQFVGPLFWVGVGCIAVAAAIALIVLAKGITITWVVVVFIGAFLLLGGLFMPTDRVLRGLRIWRKNDGNGKPAP